MSTRYNLETILLVDEDIKTAIGQAKGGHADPLSRYLAIVNRPGGLGRVSKRGHLVTAALTDCWFIGKGIADLIEQKEVEIKIRDTVKNLCIPAKTVDDSTWKGIREELSPQGRFMNFHQSLFPTSITIDENSIGDYSEAAQVIINRNRRFMELSLAHEGDVPNKRIGCPAQLRTMTEHVIAFSAHLWPQYFHD